MPMRTQSVSGGKGVLGWDVPYPGHRGGGIVIVIKGISHLISVHLTLITYARYFATLIII